MVPILNQIYISQKIREAISTKKYLIRNEFALDGSYLDNLSRALGPELYEQLASVTLMMDSPLKRSIDRHHFIKCTKTFVII